MRNLISLMFRELAYCSLCRQSFALRQCRSLVSIAKMSDSGSFRYDGRQWKWSPAARRVRTYDQKRLLQQLSTRGPPALDACSSPDLWRFAFNLIIPWLDFRIG